MRGLNEGVSSVRLFSHDHLYSPVVLLRTTGRIGEHYKYDAYGQPTIMDASYNTRQTSIDGNPYLFTGRRLDILDNGSLTIQYSRNRYYDYCTGRFTTHDPLGITPNPPKPNWFKALGQYEDGLNLYEYANSNPVINTDRDGKIISKIWNCCLCIWHLRKAAKRCAGGQCAHVCDDVCGDPATAGECAECMRIKRKQCIKDCVSKVGKSLKFGQ